jgi:hypothetical protein
MAFLQPYGTGFGYSGFQPSYNFGAPTAFAAPASYAVAEHQSQAADGSQAGEEHGSQQVSVSGFAADPNAAAYFGQFGQFGQAAPFAYGAGYPAQATFLPQTVLPSTALVPVAAPQIRRPGYNERLVAWRNRQKAFNRYKKATKNAIKNANRQPLFPAHYGAAVAPTAVYGAPYGATAFGAAPYATAFGAAPFGATYLPAYGAGYVYDQGFAAAPVAAEAQEGAYPTFGDFSQGGASQHQEAQEEPEIRGTQV